MRIAPTSEATPRATTTAVAGVCRFPGRSESIATAIAGTARYRPARERRASAVSPGECADGEERDRNAVERRRPRRVAALDVRSSGCEVAEECESQGNEDPGDRRGWSEDAGPSRSVGRTLSLWFPERRCHARSCASVPVMAVGFPTRPELRGTFGAVASTHWLASQTGMAVLERGGNAFDAACAAGFVLQVVEPHLNGPGGDLPVVFWSADVGKPLVLCAQGVVAARGDDRALSLAGPRPGTWYRSARGLRARARSAAGCSCSSSSGRGRSTTCSSIAIGYAEGGYPVVPGITETIERVEPLLREWPGLGGDSTCRRRGRGRRSATRSSRRRGAAARRSRAAPSRARGACSTRASSPRRSTGSRASTAASSRARTSRAGARRSSRRRRSTIAGSRSARPGVGAGAGGLQQLALLEGIDVGALGEAELVHVDDGGGEARVRGPRRELRRRRRHPPSC